MHKRGILISLILVTVLLLSFSTLMIPQESKSTNNCLAAGCHNDLMKSGFKHSPARDGCDDVCHSFKGGNHPGDSGNEYELNSKVPELCSGCHDIDLKKKAVHLPYKDGDCIMCHSPHSSDHKGLLKTNEGKNICSMCHDMIGKNTCVHGPVLKGDCMSCHLPHNSDNAGLLKEEGDKLCLTCHNKDIKNDSTIIRNIKSKLNKRFVHQPIKDDGCKICHSAHSSVNRNLLQNEFPNDFYVSSDPKKYAMCFKCHDQRIILLENTDSITGFRDGTKNLHFLHTGGEKGRNCNTCHDIHGSDNFHLINDRVKFGNWMMNIGYKSSENGGSCMPGCHQNKSYSRDYVLPKKIISESKANTKPQLGKVSGKIKVPDWLNKNWADDFSVQIVSKDTNFKVDANVNKDFSFSLQDLPPGSYTAILDEDAPDEIGAKTINPEINFEIKEKKEGDSVSGIVFNLEVPDRVPVIGAKPKPKPIILPNVPKYFPIDKDQAIDKVKGVRSYLKSVARYLKKKANTQVKITIYYSNRNDLPDLDNQANQVASNIANLLSSRGISFSRIQKVVKKYDEAKLKKAQPKTKIEIKIIK